MEVEANVTAAFTIAHQRYLINHHYNTLITNHTCIKEAFTFRYTPSTSAGEPNNNYCLAHRQTLHSVSLINDIPCNNQQQHHHNPNMCFNNQETASIEQLKPIISKASLLASMMEDQHIIQASISSVETFNGI